MSFYSDFYFMLWNKVWQNSIREIILMRKAEVFIVGKAKYTV